MAATTIAISSGDAQTQGIAAQLALPLVVIVTDANALPVSGVTVNFAIASVPAAAAGYSLSAASAVTDANGLAQVFLTLGDQAGTYTVTATSTGLTGSPLTFTAAGGAIVSLASVKGYLNIADTDITNDNLLVSWIGIVSEKIEAALEQPVTPRRVLDIVDGSGKPKQYTLIGRIINLTADQNGNVCQSVQYRTNTLNNWANIVNVEGYLHVSPKDAYAVEFVNWANFPKWIKNIRLDYLCGFSPIPGDIVTMALEMISIMWDESKHGSRPRLGLKSSNISTAGQSGTDSYEDLNMTRWHDTITKYRRLV